MTTWVGVGLHMDVTQGHVKVISKSQQGQISQKGVKIVETHLGPNTEVLVHQTHLDMLQVY